MRIGIIGGGASGMAAALAAVAPGNTVIVFERQARLGRKLLATGNGRCNLTNLHAGTRGYHGENPGFVWPALAAYPPEETRDWFSRLGLFTVAEPSGRVYPYSDCANSVVDVLRFALERAGVTVRVGFTVGKIRTVGSGFSVENEAEAIACDRLVLACGGLAGSKLGGSLSGYQLLGKLGHKMIPLRPSLVQLKSSWGACAALKGVRAQCRAAIYRNGVLFREDTGEIQFTEYGISGPVVFAISRDVCHGAAQWECRLDFLPQMGDDALLRELTCRCERKLSTEDLLTGMLHNRLGKILLKSAGLSLSGPSDTLSQTQLLDVCRVIKELSLLLTGPMGMDHAQVTAGGADTTDFDPRTMESRLVPGLYACGEVLDVDGDCGGFNLQWAWSSGLCAGSHAGGNGI